MYVIYKLRNKMVRSLVSPLEPHAGCGKASTFVTLVTGARYATAASCLPQMLRNVGSLCPLLLIYNDADTALPMSQLEQAYGANQMLPLSLLKARYKWQPPRSRAQVPAAGRRLFSSSEAYKTHLKLWLWALPTTHRVVYLDLDILILRNIDALLDVVPPTLPDGSPGLGAVTCKTRFGERFFNSGILVLTPSLRTLEQLLELKRFASAPWNGQIPRLADTWPDICAPRDDPFAAKRLFPNKYASHSLAACQQHYGPGHTPRKMSTACESKYTDQSILNSVFHSHASLPRGFNMQIAGDFMDANSSAIFHFVGEPKPWSHNAMTGRGKEPARRNATARWQRQCAPQ